MKKEKNKKSSFLFQMFCFFVSISRKQKKFFEMRRNFEGFFLFERITLHVRQPVVVFLFGTLEWRVRKIV
jgi:hypothetical protein